MLLQRMRRGMAVLCIVAMEVANLGGVLPSYASSDDNALDDGEVFNDVSGSVDLNGNPVSLTADCVDEFGTVISGQYENMTLPDFQSELILDDAGNPPVKVVKDGSGLLGFLSRKTYDYVQTTVDGAVVKAIRKEPLSTVKNEINQNASESDASVSNASGSSADQFLNGLVYSYTTDGTDWIRIVKDTKIKFEYSDGRKTDYEEVSTDGKVKVSATLKEADALPDNVRLVVTPVTPESDSYNAYMQALNNNASDITDKPVSFDENNALLYDISFIGPKLDENGNATGEEKEYEPTEGAVSVSMQLLDNQLTSDIGAKDASDVKFVHLPLQSSVRDSLNKTIDAANLSADDIKVEVPATSVNLDTETVSTTMDEFSMTGIVNAESGTSKTVYNLEQIVDTGSLKLTITDLNTGSTLPATVGRYDNFEARIDFTISNTNLTSAAGNRVLYQMPDGLNISNVLADQNFLDTANAYAGKFTIQSDGKVYLDLDSSYLQDHSSINGFIIVDFRLDSSVVKDQNSHAFDFPGTGTVIFNYGPTIINGNKSYSISDDGNTVTFTIHLAVDSKSENVVLTDTLGSNFEYKTGTFELHTGNADSTGVSLTPEIKDQVATINLGELAGNNYYITYDCTLKGATELKNTTEAYTNTAAWTWDGGSGSDHTTTTTVYGPTLEKSGKIDENNDIVWKITVNSNGISLDGAKVTDSLPAGLKLDHVEVYDPNNNWAKLENNEVGSYSVDSYIAGNSQKFEYDFNDHAGKKNYVIKIYTKVADTSKKETFTNSATVITVNGMTATGTSNKVDYTFNPGNGKNSKKMVSSSPISAGSSTYKTSWISTMDMSSFDTSKLTEFYFEDWIEQHWYGDSNNNWKVVKQDFVENSVVVKSGDTIIPATDYTVSIYQDNNNSTGKDRMRIEFNKPYPTGTITISYDTTTDCSVYDEKVQAVSEQFKNYCKFDYTYNGSWMGTGSKYAEWNYTRGAQTFDKQITDYSWDPDSQSFILNCSVLANASSKDDTGTEDLTDQDLKIVDLLGDNLTYVPGSATISLKSKAEDKSINGNEADPGISTDQKTLTWDFGKNKISGGNIRIYITYKVAMPITAFGGTISTLTADNTAIFTADDVQKGTDTATKDISIKPLTKTGSQEAYSQYVKYSIDVNKDAIDLLPDKSSIVLNDTLPDNCTLDTESYQIFSYNTDGTTTSLTSDEYTVSYDSNTRLLQFTVPDARHLKIEYQVKPNGTVGNWVTLINKITLVGKADISSTDNKGYYINKASGGIQGKAGSISLHKTNTAGTALAGAEFKLYRDDVSGSEVSSQEAADETTNGNGNLIFDTDSTTANNAQLQYDVLYHYKETKAPDGYEADGTNHYFIIKDQVNAYGNTVNNAAKFGITGISALTDTQVVDVTNSLLPGSLKITKAMSGIASGTDVSKLNFKFKVMNNSQEYLTFDSGNKYTGADASGTEVTVTGNGFVVLSGMPVGNYAVTEITDNVALPVGYIFTGVSYGTAGATSKEVTISTGKEADITVTNDYQSTSVSFSKKDAGGKELPGATISLLNNDADKTAVVDENGNAISWESTPATHTVTGLAAGTYWMHEVSAPAGYTTTTDVPFTIAADGKVTVNGQDVNGLVTMTDSQTSVSFSKEDAGGKELPGATLSLLNNDADKTAVVDGNGNAISWESTPATHTVTGLAAGTYWMHEVSAPSGYATTTDILFTIAADGKVTVNGQDVNGPVTMTDSQTSVSFSKEDAGGKELPGATISLLNNDADKTAVVDGNGNAISWESTSATHTVTGLAAGTYWMHEVSAPSGYATTTDILFTIAADGKVTVNGQDVNGLVTMTDSQTSVSFSKEDAGGKELPGATISLLNNDADKTAVVDGNGKAISWESTPATHTVTGLAAGTYWMHEVSAPAGYTTTTDVPFTIAADGKVTVNGQDVNGLVTMTDSQTSVSFSKEDAGGKELPGATISLLNNDADKTAVVDGNGNAISWESTSATHTVTGLAAGTYWMHEVSAPSGYATTTDILFTIAADGKVTVNGQDVNGPVTMTDSRTNVTFSKQAVGGAEIGGAKIEILNSNGDIATCSNADTGATETAEWTSEAGVSHGVTGLAAGEYTMHEVSAPAGYTTTTDIPFMISADGKVMTGTSEVTTVTMTDQLTSVSFSKEDAGGKELPGATISLLNNDADKTAVVDGNGKAISWESTPATHTVTGLAAGTYWMHEVSAPSGYATTTDILFTIAADGKVTVNGQDVNGPVTMTDSRTNVTFSKQSVGGAEIGGAKIEILNSNGDVATCSNADTGATETAEWTSEAGVSHEVTGLASGEYTMHEVSAPAGYAVATDITFTVNTDGTVTSEARDENGRIVMTDETTVTFSKQSVGGVEIGGAQIEILNSNGDVATCSNADTGATETAEWTSEAGVSHGVTGLAAGEYTMHEVSAPAGYAVATDITFTVNTDGTVTSEARDQNGRIVMTDETTVTFSKQSVGGVEIGGAQIEILNSNGDVATCSNADTGATETAEWTSEAGVSHGVTGLAAGEYTIHEVSAPAGYAVATDITFTVNTDGTVTSEARDQNGRIVMTDETTVTFSKQSVGGVEIGGAQIEILNSNGDVATCSNADTGATETAEWTSEAGVSHEVTGLAAGEYTMHEVSAPAGYAVATDITFTVNTDGTVTSEARDQNGRIVMTDETTVTFSKQSVGGVEIGGAQIEILNSNGDVATCSNADTGATETAEWTSEAGVSHGVTGLAAGEYTMHEVSAPAGYAVATDITFTVNTDGTVTSEAKDQNGRIVMTDETTVIFSKQDLGGNEIEGVQIEIRNQDGAVATDYAGNQVKWISEKDVSHEVTGLAAGEYTMHEVSAPSGYTVATDIKFTVNADGTVTVEKAENLINGKIVMKDQKITGGGGGGNTTSNTPGSTKPGQGTPSVNIGSNVVPLYGISPDETPKGMLGLPKTGDEVRVSLLILMLASILVLSGMLISEKKRRNQQ